MLFVFILLTNCFLQLADDPSKYVNYESAVNPEYYDKHYKNLKKEKPNGPNVHIKQGLSKPDEKIIFQGLQVFAIESFFQNIFVEICENPNECQKNRIFMNILEQLKNESEEIKEKFYETLRRKDMNNILNKSIDNYDSKYDQAYCNYKQMEEIVDDLNKIKLLSEKSDIKDFVTVVDKIKNAKNIFEKYKSDCMKK